MKSFAVCVNDGVPKKVQCTRLFFFLSKCGCFAVVTAKMRALALEAGL